MLNVLIAVLASKGILTEEEAVHLAKKLVGLIHPSEYKDAKRIVDKVFKELEKPDRTLDDLNLHL